MSKSIAVCLSTRVGGEEREFPLVGTELRIGRGPDNEIVLEDFSVSRNHAVLRRDGDMWQVQDLRSTNGIRLNDEIVISARLQHGDLLTVGAFELTVQELPRSEAAQGPRGSFLEDSSPPLRSVLQKVENASIIRPLAEFTAEYGLEGSLPAPSGPSAPAEVLDAGYAQRIVGFLTRLAGLLISADKVEEVLERAMDIAFEALTVERGFILLQGEDGEVHCELARNGERVELRPQGEVPVSKTIVRSVMEDRVALITHDALSDERLNRGDSIRIHGIRSALCVPLWSGEKVIGVLQLDSPFLVGRFEQRDLDFLTAVANYAAVAVERLRYAQRIQVEQELRSRLERYHSPAVIEEVMHRERGVVSGGLRTTEVTVLFADMVGFTALAEELPPQEVAEVLRTYFNDAADAVFAAGGTLDKFIGDCVMAFFGAPIPQADHARRAVDAALRILQAEDQRNIERRRQGLPALQSRVAINTGLVVVGDVGSDRRVDYTVLGNTVNIAARLAQLVAGGGEIVIGPETRRQLDSQALGAQALGGQASPPIRTESLGTFQLKGMQQSLEAFRVVRSLP